MGLWNGYKAFNFRSYIDNLADEYVGVLTESIEIRAGKKIIL